MTDEEPQTENTQPPKETRLSLSLSTLLTILAMVAGGVGANLSLMYSLHSNLHHEIVALDREWQFRISGLSEDLNSSIGSATDTSEKMLRIIVDTNIKAIEKLEKRITELEKK